MNQKYPDKSLSINLYQTLLGALSKYREKNYDEINEQKQTGKAV